MGITRPAEKFGYEYITKEYKERTGLISMPVYLFSANDEGWLRVPIEAVFGSHLLVVVISASQ
jgi:hypothetical protein